MTLLRRTAQLVEDLRTLKLIKEKDIVDFKYCSDGSIRLDILFNSPSSATVISSSHIEIAIEQEFDKQFIFELKSTSRQVSCRILPHWCNRDIDEQLNVAHFCSFVSWDVTNVYITRCLGVDRNEFFWYNYFVIFRIFKIIIN